MKKEITENIKKTSTYMSVLEKFPDAQLIDVKNIEKGKKNE